jgi:scyllo-inositol 2-dehydrogenase (NADP+)
MTIGVGLAGYGLSGAVLHAPLIEALPDYRIAAVMTSRAEEAAARRDRPAVVADIAALVARDDVDLVVVVTPNELHEPQAAAALKAGKHVVIDKPMATGSAACDRLIGIAADAGRLLSVYHNRRWDGDFVAAQAELAREAPLLAEMRWDRFRPQAPDVWRNRGGAGTGLLWDLGAHMIDQAVQLFGWPDAMAADIATQRATAGADDHFELRFDYGERRVILSASSIVAATRPRFALHGPSGSWWTEGLDPAEAALRAHRLPLGLDPIPAFRAHKDGERLPDPVAPGDPLAFYRLMAAAIRGEGPVPVDPRDARDVVAIIEAAHGGAPLPAPRGLRAAQALG